ncbi:MAG: pyridoxal phosphate-dependent aminotransferase [Tissierellia bacterium]|nr:pyridoxal phosphate-dependent aminotransferase [Tissierellia bacterium]
MKYNFDELVDRRNSDSVKWRELEEFQGEKDVLPMWVADMDFKSSDEIIEALKTRVEHGIFGYPYIDDSFYESIINWIKNRYNWEIKKEWILFTPGVVMGLNIGVRELVEEGEKVLVQSPVYPPFYRVVNNNKRIVNNVPLIHNGEKFVMDYENLEKKIDDDTKLMMLCSPHNPVGRVWTKEELIKLGDICINNNIIIISDEIHCDLTLKGHKHIPLASISKELEERTITLMAPSKTFNIAGLHTSVAIIPNENLRNKYSRAIEIMEIGNISIFGALALETAYNHGGQWLKEVMEYIESNIDFAIDYINKNIPEIKVHKPEGTYLLWLDFRSLNKSSDEISEALIKNGKVYLNDGRPYGPGGEGYFRLNIACPRAILEDGLNRIEKAVKSLQ